MVGKIERKLNKKFIVFFNGNFGSSARVTGTLYGSFESFGDPDS